MNKRVIDQLDLRTKKMFERLLKTSPPNRERRYAMVKLLLSEDSSMSREQLNLAIGSFYKLAYERRTAEQFRRTFAVKPYPWLLDQFSLSFRTAVVSETRVFRAATAFRHMIRNVLSVPEAISGVDVFHLVVHRITRPRIDQIAAGIGIRTFSRRWRDVSFFKFGSGFEEFFDKLDEAIEHAETNGADHESAPTSFYKMDSPSEWVADPEITQTDLDWLKNLLQAFDQNCRPPLYPLKRGPIVPTLIRMERLVREAHRRFPVRHGLLEEAVVRGCRHYLEAFKQEESNESKTA